MARRQIALMQRGHFLQVCAQWSDAAGRQEGGAIFVAFAAAYKHQPLVKIQAFHPQGTTSETRRPAP